jgi:hypothetical protein
MSFTTKLNGGLDFANKGTERMKHNLGDKQQATERAVAWKQDSMKQKRQVMKSKYLLRIASPCSHDNSLSITSYCV